MGRSGGRWRDKPRSSPKSEQLTKIYEGRVESAQNQGYSGGTYHVELNVLYMISGNGE